MTANQETPEVKTRKRGLSFYVKVFVTFILLLSLSVGIGIYYVYHRLTSDDRFEQVLMTRISEAIKMQVSFDKLDIAFPGFTINNAVVATDSPELKLNARISKISLTPDFWAAFKGKLVLDSLNIGSGTIDIKTSKSKTAFVDAKAAGDKPAVDLSKVVFPFNSFYAEALQLNYQDTDSGKKHALLLRQASLETSLLSSALPFQLELTSPQYADLSLDGQLYWPDTVQASLQVKNVNLAEIKALVPDDYKKQFALLSKPEVKINLVYKIADNSLKVSDSTLSAEPGINLFASAQINSFSPLNGTLSANLRPLPAQFLLQLAGDLLPAEYEVKISSGQVSAKVELALKDSQLASTRVSVTPEKLALSARPLPQPLNLDSGSMTYDGEKLIFAAFKAGFAGNRLELASGELFFKPFGFSGKLAADIDFDAMWPVLEPMLPESARRVTPSGKADFKGSIAYKNEKVNLNGELNSSLLKLKEASTGASGNLEALKVKLVELSPSAGKIEIASLKLKGAGGDIAISGTITNSADPAFAMKAAGKIDLADFSALAASIFKLPVRKDQFAGKLSLDMSLGGTLADLQPKGTISFADIKADLRERGLVIAGLNGNAAADSKTLEVKNLVAQLMGGKLELSGVIKDFKKPQVQAQASIVAADLGQVRNLISLNFPDMPKELEISGQSDLMVKVNGPIVQPKIEGSSVLKAVRFFHPAVLRPIEDISGPVDFNNAGLSTIRLKAKWGTSEAVVKGALRDWGKLISDFSFSVDPLDATDAAGFFLKDTGYKLTATGKGEGKITGELEKIKVEGNALLPEGLFSAPISEKGTEVFKFPFKNLNTTFVYTGGVFSVPSAETMIFSGKVSAEGKIDLNQDPIAFNFKTRLDQVETSDFLKENTKFSKALRGGLDGNADISGNTTGLDSINGTADLLMKKGAYSSPPVIQKICEQLNAMHLASGTIENLSGDYKIAGGRISSKNTMAKSKDGRMTYTGSVGLDASLDGNLVLDINRAACQQSQILRQMVGSNEFLSVPVSLKGSLTSPSVGIPIEKMIRDAAQKEVKKAVEKKAGDALGKILGFGKNTSTPTASQSADPGQAQNTTETRPEKKIEKKLKDVGKDLKKLFKF